METIKVRWIVAVLASIIITILHFALFTAPTGQRLEMVALDKWFNWRGPIEAPQDIVVVAMDEQSYINLDVPLTQPWPRALHAKLLKKLKEFGAKRVVFDILFLDRGSNPDTDSELAEAIKDIPTVLGADLALRQESTAAGTFTYEELLQPYGPFLKSAEAIGLVGLPQDYGVIRRFPTERSEQFPDLPFLFEAAAPKHPKQRGKPTESDFIQYYGPARSIKTYSYYQLLEEEQPLPPQLFKDKTIFVGLVLRTEVGPAQKDVFQSPFYQERIFGVEIHGIAAANLLKEDWISRADSSKECLYLSLYALLASIAIILLRPLPGLIVVLASLIGWTLIAYNSFLSGLFVPGMILTAMVLPILFLSTTLTYYFVTRRQQLQIRGAFERYLSPEMAGELAKSGKALELGGEKLWATALFTDIEGFTSITEEMPAEKVSAMLNSYFTEVMDVIFDNKGTLIKFIGDAVFVLWGAPIKTDNHAELAVLTALAIQEGVAQFNESGRFPPLNTRVGVNTGPMVVGNLGSAKRFDYTAIGDSVNLAARLEGMNKYFGTNVLVSEATKKEIGGSIELVKVGTVRVAGKTETVEVFTVWKGLKSDENKKLWSTALELFEAQDWNDAKAAFKETAQKLPQLEGAADLYLKEIEKNERSTLDQGWAGEIDFDRK